MDTWAVWYGSMGIAFEKAQTTNAGWSIEKGDCVWTLHKLTSFVPGSIRMNG